ncbi:signal peptidase I [Paeniclostridium sordellii]|uniref:signal peptidase I n=1 Tax=Paraclostridium sordellii TaxID=1505 RepID=UPI001F06160C|nr:signal peptidase I [Paeniclostridium sordellii]MCH1964657.1 signal peptidase I [Paeniclostridium sordellii]MCQ4699152.1 signal peptidase I [Paeniclostridium sordellii]MDU6482811.1 signal peptidase I [Paeniclostridium sordellii]
MKKNKISRFLKDLAPIFIVLICILSLKITTVSGKSMNTTLNDKDYLVINKLAYLKKDPKRGDIIVFKSNLVDYDGNNKDLIKRVIGLPGDKLKIKNGKVYVNNEEFDTNNIYTSGDIDIVVPKNNVFVMGDNRGDSVDSRNKEVGVVNIDNIVGKVFCRLYPLEKFKIF